jgi:hypothetical protein
MSAGGGGTALGVSGGFWAQQVMASKKLMIVVRAEFQVKGL